MSIELELFPGKSANVLQRSVVRCQSTFERIREAYAEIFGYEYRPGVIKEAYLYNSQLDENREKQLQSRRTRKNRQ